MDVISAKYLSEIFANHLKTTTFAVRKIIRSGKKRGKNVVPACRCKH